jgi:hypothetical protein
MKSIFNPDDKNEILSRIDKLDPSLKPLWGKMNVSQMLAHCVIPTKVSAGEINGRQTILGKLFGGIAKKRIISEEPFKKGLPTDPNFVIKETPDFYKSREELKEAIQRLHDTDKTELVKRKHPFFGTMNIGEWGILNYKHYDHHLRQFGV